MASYLSYTASKNQLKWLGSKNDLLEFLSGQFGVESNKISVHDNGSCLVLKSGQITCNFYVKAKTLQIQGKECDELKNNLISLAKEIDTYTGSILSSSSAPAEVPNQDGAEGSQPDETNSHNGVDCSVGPRVIDLSDHPFTPHCAYVSHFKSEIANMKKELLDLRLFVL